MIKNKSKRSRQILKEIDEEIKLKIIDVLPKVPEMSQDEADKTYKSIKCLKNRVERYLKGGLWISSEVEYRIRNSFSSLMNYHIKKNGTSINKIIKNKLGYSVKDLIKHLEKKFDKNMNWENYGSYWHVDHITPASWFKYNSFNDDQFRQCWSLDNLQPLEARKNMSKGNRYSG